jgi:hypothetical protein
MTFEEWWETEGRKWEPSGQSNVAWMAWEAATTAERERCAKVCEDVSDEFQLNEGKKYAELKTDAESGALHCAARIRATP